MNKIAILEGILFIVGDEGILKKRLNEILEIDDEELERTIKELSESYNDDSRGLQLEVYGDIIKIVTKKEHKDYYTKLLEVEDEGLLSQAALETLAIIAYNEPITRVDVDEIRGISSAHVVRKLLSRNLIEERGKSDAPGRPNLYGVTDSFLDYFGIKTVEELPKIENIQIDMEEKDLFESKYKDDIQMDINSEKN